MHVIQKGNNSHRPSSAAALMEHSFQEDELSYPYATYADAIVCVCVCGDDRSFWVEDSRLFAHVSPASTCTFVCVHSESIGFEDTFIGEEDCLSFIPLPIKEQADTF